MKLQCGVLIFLRSRGTAASDDVITIGSALGDSVGTGHPQHHAAR